MNRLWQQLSDFLHQANLIPLVVIVSTYHYYQALRSHDPLPVAMPIALFVDLLHFRTVQRAVRADRVVWKLTALFTTAITFGLQWIFYSQPINSVALPGWQALLFASIIPVGLGIMAWHHETQSRDVMIDWQGKAETARKQAEQAQVEAVAAQERVQQARAEMSQARQAEVRLQGELDAARNELEAALAGAAAARVEVTRLQTAVDEAEPTLQAWQAMNQRLQVAAQVHVGQLSAQEAAEIIGMSVDTVRRDVARLNGAR